MQLSTRYEYLWMTVVGWKSSKAALIPKVSEAVYISMISVIQSVPYYATTEAKGERERNALIYVFNSLHDLFVV